AVVGGVVPRLHDDDARKPQALLEQPVIRHRRVGGSLHRRLETRIVNMNVAVGRSCRGLELRGMGAGSVRNCVSCIRHKPLSDQILATENHTEVKEQQCNSSAPRASTPPRSEDAPARGTYTSSES